ncbi:MAG: PTS glucitol/sorbitol transporter subunit IIA [Lachnospiraceae bacterium]|nr:PTS glucitol/sorbitol transporter subunit IIA [Lachnospiraceae bacterium]
MKYRATITGFGPEAFEFLSEALDLNFVIIFNEDAPEELAELSILHTKGDLLAVPVAGDIMKLGKNIYTITAVGTEVEQTLSTLGHCTLAFGGAKEAYRPGCIMLDGPVLTKEAVPAGETIEIY